MTEAEWLECIDPRPMLEFMRGKASDRKFRLFAVACCRHIWPLLIDVRSRKVIELSEQFADGGASAEELLNGLRDASEAAEMVPSPPDAAEAACYEMVVPEFGLAWAAGAAADAAAHATATTPYQEGVGYDYDHARVSAERVVQCHLVRDIFGNPFRTLTIDQFCRTPTQETLACTIYDERSFDRLPELAEALELAGCHDAGMLGHCRNSGLHVRGCWVVDMLLGKK
jgi:hypothetical protein